MPIKQARGRSLGRMPDRYFDGIAFTNITEIISDSEFNTILCLCGINPVGLSDYDRFKAFCRVIPLLSRHPIVAKVSSLLKLCFGIEIPCTIQTCDDIWQTVSSKLFKMPMNGVDCLKVLNYSHNAQLLIDCDQLTKIDICPNGVELVLYGNSLIETSMQDWGSWKAEIERTTDHLGSRYVYFKLTNEMAYDPPSLYHVEQALRENSTERTGLLLAQALRELCLICRQKEMTLYLDIESTDKKRVVLLLERIYKSVGLPHIVFFTRDLSTLDAMISLSATLPIGLLTCGFLTGNYPSANELKTAYEATVARYPAGLLNIFYGFDLRYSNYEKDRFLAL